MSSRIPFLALLLCVSGANLNAQSKADEDALRKLPQAHCDACNKHDAHELVKIFAEDGDFVTVATVYVHGRADYESFMTDC